MAAKAFLEQYMDCMDALPLDMQRHASQYWDLDMKSQDLLSEALCVQSGSTRALAVGATAADKRKWLIQLQRWMLAIMEVGTEKVEVTSHMLDTVEGYSQQLSLAEKEMVSCRTREELTGGGSSRSNSNATFNSHTHKSVQHSLPALLEVVEKRKIERNQKRARTQDKGEESDVPAANPPKEARRDSSTSATSVPTTISANTNLPTVKPVKNKKVKTSKKKNSIPRDQPQPHPLPPTPTPVSAAVPTPDFTTEPIDPDEPTYCLCNQVSFGEMIGCDNDDCPIEWFHFQCVGLTAKPKGKWYCPQCQRSKPRSGKS